MAVFHFGAAALMDPKHAVIRRLHPILAIEHKFVAAENQMAVVGMNGVMETVRV